MRSELHYLGKSEVGYGPYRSMIRFSPNLSREPVWFTGELKHPVRFREAMSALHEVVVGDFRYQKRDKSAYRAWLADEKQKEEALRRAFVEQEKKKILDEMGDDAPPADLEKRFREAHRRYWKVRVQWANELARHDPELFRHLVPCDPVVTVAPDVVFFEGFAKDESSYGCVYLDRDAIEGDQQASVGTTNVDYSMALYESFQTLRSYRQTRLHVDPEGFEVRTEGHPDYREEKIDLPPSWLRGFGQISAATGLPAQRVPLSVSTVYSMLAYLKRHREKTGPRSLRFVLTPGRPPSIVLEPWGVEVGGVGEAWEGERATEIKVWGRRRLSVLARVLPLAERFEVHLLGSGLPSVWVAYLGEMRFVLALSGWTTNDWSSGAQLDLLAGTYSADDGTVKEIADLLRAERSLGHGEIERAVHAPEKAVWGALHRLAKQGQVIYDFGASRYRYRQILEAPLGEALLGPEPEELTEGRKLFVGAKVSIERKEALPNARTLYVAKVGSTRCETIIDADGVFSRASCPCVHHRRFGLRQGPCRHLLALRLTARPGSITS